MSMQFFFGIARHRLYHEIDVRRDLFGRRTVAILYSFSSQLDLTILIMAAYVKAGVIGGREIKYEINGIRPTRSITDEEMNKTGLNSSAGILHLGAAIENSTNDGSPFCVLQGKEQSY
jgi:hypothetical protein